MAPRRRISKDFLQSLRDQLARAKEQRDKFIVLSEGKDSLFWKSIQEQLDGKAKSIEWKLDGWADMHDKELHATLEQRKMYRFFKELVEESDNGIAVLDNRIAELEKSIREANAGRGGAE